MLQQEWGQFVRAGRRYRWALWYMLLGIPLVFGATALAWLVEGRVEANPTPLAWTFSGIAAVAALLMVARIDGRRGFLAQIYSALATTAFKIRPVIKNRDLVRQMYSLKAQNAALHTMQAVYSTLLATQRQRHRLVLRVLRSYYRSYTFGLRARAVAKLMNELLSIPADRISNRKRQQMFVHLLRFLIWGKIPSSGDRPEPPSALKMIKVIVMSQSIRRRQRIQRDIQRDTNQLHSALFGSHSETRS